MSKHKGTPRLGYVTIMQGLRDSCEVGPMSHQGTIMPKVRHTRTRPNKYRVKKLKVSTYLKT